MIRNLYLTACVVFFFCSFSAIAQNIPSPKEHFGFNIGDDYQLANYTQTEAYFKKLAAAAPDRAKLVDIGPTEEGRRQYMMVVSSAANIKNLEHYKQISQKLAHAENLSDNDAKALAMEGKAVVWIDGGLHASEVVATQQLIEIIYQVLSRTDAETERILDNVIILFVHANPDGQELVSNWYMHDADPKKRSLNNVPRLWAKYIGHDNNRDFFMLNMKESQNISRQQFVEWMPQIIYNHHQAGPPGSVVAGPPYRDPFNYVFDPLLVTSIDAVGAAMNNRLNVENKPGYTQRAGSEYSTWWNGGLRTTAYFHNMVGLLTEIIGSPTPSSIPLVPERLIPNMATPNPVTPQAWHFRQSIDYSVSLNYAVLDYAARQREELLFGIYRMGKNAIEHGSADHWTLSPRLVDSVNSIAQRAQDAAGPRTGGRAGGAVTLGRSDTASLKYYNQVYRSPEYRDARGYIIPANQADFPTAVKFINALILSGISVQKATADFTVKGKAYPAGSYIVKTAQAFRPHVLDMFEPQNHPNDFQYPGGPPIRPYDAAGWTLAYDMGVQFDRITDGFDGPFQTVPYGQLQSAPIQAVNTAQGGYLLSAKANNSFIAVNLLLSQGVKVYRLPNGISAVADAGPGTFFIPSNAKTQLQKVAGDLSIRVIGSAKLPANAIKISALRIGLWDMYGGSMPSGWVRWILEQYHFSFKRIYAKEIDKGDLRKNYDMILFVGGAIPQYGEASGRRGGGAGGFGMPRANQVPAEYADQIGRISRDSSIASLKTFINAGGNIVTIGSSTTLAYYFDLPVRNQLTEVFNGQERALPGEKFYVPGSIMRVSIDSAQSAAWGMAKQCDIYFDSSPVFKIAPEAIAKGQINPIAWYASAITLRSGWAWGQNYLQDGVAAFEAPVGAGKFYAFGPEITFRGQTQGVFKMLFNEFYGMR
jgi:hypothetical protein